MVNLSFKFKRERVTFLFFDDVLATGGTAKGSIEVLKKAGYTHTSALFLVELDFLNPKLDVPHQSLIHYE